MGMYRYRKVSRSSIALVVLAFVAVLLVSLPRTFAVSDDVAIDADIRGGFPTSFQSSLVGATLSFLHRHVAGGVPWYALYLYAALAAALAVIAAVAMRLELRPGGCTALAVAELLLAAEFVVELGYNDVSILCTTAGMMGLAVLLRREERPRVRDVLFLGCVFALGYLTRKAGIAAGLAFGALPFLLLAGRRLARSPAVAAIFLLPLAASLAGTFLVDATADEVHGRFREWNAVRGRLHNFPVVDAAREDPSVFEDNGWTSNDYRLLAAERAFADEDRFNVGTLTRALETTVPVYAGLGWSGAWERIEGTVVAKNQEWILLLVALAIAAGMARGVSAFAAAGSAALVALGIASALAVFLRFPERIAEPAFYSATAWGLLLALAPGGPPPSRPRLTLLLATSASLLLGVVGAGATLERADARVRLREGHYSCFERVQVLEPELVIVDPAIALWLGVDPLRGAGVLELPHVSLGWQIYSPRFYAQLAGFGMTRATELFPFAVDREVLFVGPRAFVRVIGRYLGEAHGTEVQIVVIDEGRKGIPWQPMISKLVSR